MKGKERKHLLLGEKENLNKRRGIDCAEAENISAKEFLISTFRFTIVNKKINLSFINYSLINVRFYSRIYFKSFTNSFQIDHEYI